MRFAAKLTLVSLILAAPVAAQTSLVLPGPQQGPLRFGDRVDITTVSGNSSSTTTRLEAQSDDGRRYGLYGARFLEKSDEPCHIVALFDSLTDPDINDLDLWSACGNGQTPNPGSNAAAGFGDVPGLDRRAFVTGVEVCLNNNKVKGVRFTGARITRRGRIRAISPEPAAIGGAGSLSHTKNQVEPSDPIFWRTNCAGWTSDKWQSSVSCPATSAATALIVHHVAATGNSSRRQATGLQLECRNVFGALDIFVPDIGAKTGLQN